MPNPDSKKYKKKQLLRKQLKSARVQASSQFDTLATSSIAFELSQLNIYKTAKNIALYLPFNHEFPTKAIIHRNLLMGKRTFVPRITSTKQSKMQFIELDHDIAKRLVTKKKTLRSLSRNTFGIDEPTRSRISIHVRSLDIIFVPLLGFDNRGNRLGMGGGYYDRALSFKRNLKYIRKPYLIGLAFEAQQIDKIQIEPWDVSLDAIITEKKRYSIRSSLR